MAQQGIADGTEAELKQLVALLSVGRINQAGRLAATLMSSAGPSPDGIESVEGQGSTFSFSLPIAE